MNRSIYPSGSQRNIKLHRQSSSTMAGLLSSEVDVVDSQDAVCTSDDGQPMLVPEASSLSEGLSHSNERQNNHPQHQPPAPKVGPISKIITVGKLTREHLHRENEISGKDYVFSNFFESTEKQLLDPLPLPLAPATTSTNIAAAAATTTDGRVVGAGMTMYHPQPLLASHASKTRRRSTQGWMSPTRRHPYKSSRHPVKPRPFVLPAAADNSRSGKSPLQKDQVAAAIAFMDLQRLHHRLEEVRHLQTKPRLPSQRAYSESDAIQNEYSIIHGPTPMEISQSIHASRQTSPGPMTAAATPMDISRTVRTSRVASPSPMTVAAAATVVASSSIRTVEQQEQNVPSTPSAFPTPPGFSATPYIPKTMMGEDEGRLEEAQERRRPQKKQLQLQQPQEQEQINTPSDEAEGVMDQYRDNHGWAMQGGNDDMDDVVSEKGPEEHAQDLKQAKVEIKLAKQRYKEAETNLRMAQEQAQAVEFERRMQQSRHEDRIFLRQQQQQTPTWPSGATTPRILAAPPTSRAPLFSSNSSRGSSIASVNADSELSEGFWAFVQHLPQVYPPPSSLMHYYQQQNQQVLSGNGRNHLERNLSTAIREVQAKAPIVDKGKGPKVRESAPPEEDAPLVDRRFTRRLSSMGSPSLPPAGTSAQRADNKTSVNQSLLPPMQTRPHQNHPRGRALYMDYEIPVVIPSSVGSVSDRLTDDEFFSDRYLGLPSHLQKRVPTPNPFKARRRGLDTPHRHQPLQTHHHRSQSGHLPSKSPRIKKQSSSPSPPTRSPPPSPVYDHSLSSSGSYPSPSASRIEPPPTLQRNRTDPPLAHPPRNLVHRPVTRAVARSRSHPQLNHHHRHPQQPKQDPQSLQRQHRQQHQPPPIHKPAWKNFVHPALGRGGSSFVPPLDTATTGLNADSGGSAARSGGSSPRVVYNIGSVHHYYYHCPPQQTNMPSSSISSNGRFQAVGE